MEAIGAAMLERLHTCPVGRNHALVGEADTMHEAIELELDAPPSSPSPSPVVGIRRVTELAMELCADGRQRGGAATATRVRGRRRVRCVRAGGRGQPGRVRRQ